MEKTRKNTMIYTAKRLLFMALPVGIIYDDPNLMVHGTMSTSFEQ
jgi:hypothetical protein